MGVVPKPTPNFGEGGCHGKPQLVLTAVGSVHGCSSKIIGIDEDSSPKEEESGGRNVNREIGPSALPLIPQTFIECPCQTQGPRTKCQNT